MAYVTTHRKNPNTMLWSTSPTNRSGRGEAAKKDIAKMPTQRRPSRIFKGYSKTIEPSDTIYNSKPALDVKKGHYIPDLARQRDRSLMVH